MFTFAVEPVSRRLFWPTAHYGVPRPSIQPAFHESDWQPWWTVNRSCAGQQPTSECWRRAGLRISRDPVGGHVGDQVMLLPEHLAADVAPEWLLPSVLSLMSQEQAAKGEHLGAEAA